MIKFFIITLIVIAVLTIINLFLKKPDTVAKKLVTSLLQLAAAIFLGTIILPIGFVYSLGKAVVEMKPTKFFVVIYNLFKEFLLAIGWIANKLAVGIDIIGNVIAGEMLEDVITAKEDTLFGQSGVTISASTGHLEVIGKLNKVGKWFTKSLSFFFEPNHSVNAYESLKQEGYLDRKLTTKLASRMLTAKSDLPIGGGGSCPEPQDMK